MANTYYLCPSLTNNVIHYYWKKMVPGDVNYPINSLRTTEPSHDPRLYEIESDRIKPPDDAKEGDFALFNKCSLEHQVFIKNGDLNIYQFVRHDGNLILCSTSNPESDRWRINPRIDVTKKSTDYWDYNGPAPINGRFP